MTYENFLNELVGLLTPELQRAGLSAGLRNATHFLQYANIDHFTSEMKQDGQVRLGIYLKNLRNGGSELKGYVNNKLPTRARLTIGETMVRYVGEDKRDYKYEISLNDEGRRAVCLKIGIGRNEDGGSRKAYELSLDIPWSSRDHLTEGDRHLIVDCYRNFIIGLMPSPEEGRDRMFGGPCRMRGPNAAFTEAGGFADVTDVKIVSKVRDAKGRKINVGPKVFEKILRGFSRLGATWIETLEGRKEPRERNWVRLRKVAGIEFDLFLNRENSELICKGKGLSLTEREVDIRQKMSGLDWNANTVNGGGFSFSKERQGILVGADGEINDELLAQLYSDYKSVLTMLIQEGVFKEREDPLAKQFESPKESRSAIKLLERSLVFAMSNGSHELFHTNVWAWLIRQDPVFSKVFFPEINGTVEEVHREQGNRDLTIWVNDNGIKRAYVVENKFKSYPRRDQLEGYRKELGDQFAAGLLVVLNSPPANFEDVGWVVKTQSEVCRRICECIEKSNLESAFEGGTNEKTRLNRGLILDYIAMTENMTSIMDSYSAALGERWALSLDRDRGDNEGVEDLQSIKLQDIFKKMNAAKMVAYLEGSDGIQAVREFLAQNHDDLRLGISHDFLHKLPVLNCEIVKRYDPGDPKKKIAIGVMLQGASFARCACSFDKEKYKGAKRLYDDLRKESVGWFDDNEFLIPGQRIVSQKKRYKQYVTNDYTVAYQDIGLSCYSFESICNVVIAQLGELICLLKNNALDSFFEPPVMSGDQDLDED